VGKVTELFIIKLYGFRQRMKNTEDFERNGSKFPPNSVCSSVLLIILADEALWSVLIQT
jgi:hypothetical protein